MSVVVIVVVVAAIAVVAVGVDKVADAVVAALVDVRALSFVAVDLRDNVGDRGRPRFSFNCEDGEEEEEGEDEDEAADVVAVVMSRVLALRIGSLESMRAKPPPPAPLPLLLPPGDDAAVFASGTVGGDATDVATLGKSTDSLRSTSRQSTQT